MPSSAQTTPGRRTRITIGHMPEVVTQLPFVYERRAEEIARGTQAADVEIKYVEGIGLRLRAHQDDIGRLFERADAQDKFLTGAAVQIADNWGTQLVHRQYDYPELNYVDSGAATTVPMYEKRVPAGADWDGRLDADEAAFPGPVTSENPSPLDRVFKTTEVHRPDHALYLIAFVPFSPARGGPWGTIYFTGPAGTNKAGKGTGQYACKAFMDGKCRLYERCKTGVDLTGRAWVRRFEFEYAIDPGPDRLYYIRIESNASESCGSTWKGSIITFSSYQQAPISKSLRSHGILGVVNSAASIGVSGSKPAAVYKVPLEEVHPPELEPVRVDFRRDVRGLLSVSNASFPETVTFDDDPFVVTGWPTAGTPMRVEWYGDFPPGADLDIRLYDAEADTELPDGELIVHDCLGGVREYPMTAHDPSHRRFFARITKTSDGDVTPTMIRYRVVRRGTIDNPEFDTVVLPTARVGSNGLGRQEIVDLIEIDDATDDPMQETASVVIADFTAEMPELQYRVRQPVDVDVIDGSGNIVTKLARFYINPNESEQIAGELIGPQANVWPKAGSRRYRLSGNGEATRLKSMLFPHRWSLLDEPAEGESTPINAMKVTDGLYTGFSFAGYGPNRIDVPDLPIRFFPGDADSQDLIVEPFAEIYPWIVENSRDYLGGWPVFDLNAGDDGMWRIIQQKRPPYNVVMRFTGLHPGAGKLPHLLASYPVDNGIGDFSTQLIPHNFIEREGAKRHTEPPEGNCVMVLGGVPVGGAQVASQLTQFLFNPVSCNFFNLASSHDHYPDSSSPDFMGGDAVPIVVIDATLSDPEAVNWVGRRVFDYSCYAREYWTFHAPLRYIVDVTDEYQTYPRRPRFGDVVEVLQDDGVTWTTFLVVRCSPSYERDGFQFARYELVTSSVIQRFGMPVGAFDLFVLEKLRRKALHRSQGHGYRSQFLRTANRKVEVGAASMVMSPAMQMGPIQEIDPDEATFGTFNFMPDYDPLP